MPRVIPSDVTDIYPTAQPVPPFLMTASMLVDTYLGTSGLSVGLLAEIERWLTAHLMNLGSGAVVRRRMGSTDISYERGQLGKGLQATRFGQTVLALDSTGILGSVGLRRATIHVD